MPAGIVGDQDGVGGIGKENDPVDRFPDNRGDGAADLGGMRVHRLGVGEGHPEASGQRTGRTGRAEDVGPHVAAVADGAEAAAAARPEPGGRARPADARVRHGPRTDGGQMADSSNRIPSGLLRACSGIAATDCGKVS